MDIKFLYFDVANTLLYKPFVWKKINEVLASHGYKFGNDFLKSRHKLVSEIIKFPDKTSMEFYEYFNREFLLSLGVIPSKNLLKEIFVACDNQSWEKFEDTNSLNEIQCPIGVLSNWDSTLKEKLSNHFPFPFESYIISSVVGDSKPNHKIFEAAIQAVDLAPNQIAFVGDSIKLDISPAKEIGLIPILIDRDNLFTHFRGHRITHLSQLKAFLIG